jgi:hypothetical protein
MDEQEGQWDCIEVQTNTLCNIVVHTGFLLVATKARRRYAGGFKVDVEPLCNQEAAGVLSVAM